MQCGWLICHLLYHCSKWICPGILMRLRDIVLSWMELDVDKVSLATYFQVPSYMSMISPFSTCCFLLIWPWGRSDLFLTLLPNSGWTLKQLPLVKRKLSLGKYWLNMGSTLKNLDSKHVVKVFFSIKENQQLKCGNIKFKHFWSSKNIL